MQIWKGNLVFLTLNKFHQLIQIQPSTYHMVRLHFNEANLLRSPLISSDHLSISVGKHLCLQARAPTPSQISISS